MIVHQGTFGFLAMDYRITRNSIVLLSIRGARRLFREMKKSERTEIEILSPSSPASRHTPLNGRQLICVPEFPM